MQNGSDGVFRFEMNVLRGDLHHNVHVVMRDGTPGQNGHQIPERIPY